MVYLEKKVQLVLLEFKEKKEFKVHLVQLEKKVLLVQLVTKDLLVHPDLLVLKD